MEAILELRLAEAEAEGLAVRRRKQVIIFWSIWADFLEGALF